MTKISKKIRGAVTGFMVLLCKGLMDDSRWDWDVENCNWEKYKNTFSEPTILRSTISVFLNNLEVDSQGIVLNYVDARYRAFQYFRSHVDNDFYKEFELWELEEQA
jgi:hypothetical protein